MMRLSLCGSESLSTTVNLAGAGRRRNVPVRGQAELAVNYCRIIANEKFGKGHWWAGLRPCRMRRDVCINSVNNSTAPGTSIPLG
jgi:hypothetical protein